MFIKKCFLALCALAFSFGNISVHAEDLLAQLFCDHMVMQRGVPVPVWGWAPAGETVTVQIDEQSKTGTADAKGKWMVKLDAMDMGKPRKMTVKSKAAAVEINDILLGDVWVCSGQSNMAWFLKQSADGPKEVAAADFPEIRLFNIPWTVTPDGPVEHFKNDNSKVKNMCIWLPCSPETAKEFSGVGYFFGRNLHQHLNVPIGLISNAVGGSPIEGWVSRDALMSDPDFKAVAQYWEGLSNFVKNTPQGQRELEEQNEKYAAKQKELKAAGKPALWPTTYQKPWEHTGYPGTLFNGLTNPVIPYAIRGVIWYQGEAQWRWPYEYRGIFPLLIKDWRTRWGQGDFPFLFVQLASWSKPNTQPDPGGTAWVRESQLATLKKSPNTAMAVTIDIGDADNIHPANKQDVGKRLSLAARVLAHGEKIEYSGPIYRDMKVEGAAIRLQFDHIGTGLEAKGGDLKHFTIAGKDMKFVWATAKIDGETVVVQAEGITEPAAVRYAWSSNPDGCNLYNKEGLPASPFRTDTEPTSTMGAYYKGRLAKPFTLQPEK